MSQRDDGYLNRKPRPAPVLVITALAEEGSVVQEALSLGGFRQGRGGSIASINYVLYLDSKQSPEEIYCVVVSAVAMGRLEAAIATSIACNHFHPVVVFLVGIAGGFRFGSNYDLALGDVVIAEKIVDVDYRRIYASDDIQLRGRPYTVDYRLAEIAMAVSRSSWYTDIPRRFKRYAVPRVYMGTFASADGVTSDPQKILYNIARNELIEYTGETAIGVEMEGAGVALAVYRCAPNAKFLMIRGISDFADKFKSDDFRDIANYGAAVFFVAMINSQEFHNFIKPAGNRRPGAHL